MESDQDKEKARKITEYSEAFQLFDKDLDYVISSDEIGLLLQSLNRNPTYAEIQQFIQKVDPDDTGRVEHSNFIAQMLNEKEELNPEEQMRDAINICLKNSQNSTQSLNMVFERHEEPFTPEEFAQLLSELDPRGEKKFDPEDIIKLVMSSYQ